MTQPRHQPPRAQSGVALITVLVIVVLGLIAVMGAFRMAGLAESMTGNVADQSRTYAAAEATLRDAEHDIRGRLPALGNPDLWAPDPTDGGLGAPCKTGAAGAGLIFVGCRTVDAVPGSSNDHLWVPRSTQEYSAAYQIALAVDPTNRCFEGICVPDSLAALAALHTPALLPQVFAGGAAYGAYTGAAPVAASSNPSLALNRTVNVLPGDGQPWSRYWIEVFRYAQIVNNGPAAAAQLVPDPNAPFVFRITAIAQGRKPGSRVVLREIFVPYPASQNP